MPMRRPVDPSLEDQLRRLVQLFGFTQKDTRYAMEIYEPFVVALIKQKPVQFPELHFAAKTLIRTLFGELDAVGSLMRRIVVLRASEVDIGVSNKDLAKLSERRYDRNTDTVTDVPVRFLPTLDSFKLGLKFFPLIFDEELELDFGESGWQSLVALKRARDSFTHPQGLADLVPLDALAHLLPAFLWSQATLSTIARVCARAYGNPDAPVKTRNFRYQKIEFPVDPRDIFDKEFYELVAKSGASSIRYAMEVLSWLNDDTKRAIDVLRAMQKRVNPKRLVKQAIESDYGMQFAARNFLRTFFSEVEGTISYATFFLKSAVERGEITLTSDELAGLESDSIADQLWLSSALWSREFGFKKSVDRSSEGWKSFVKAIEWRNKITHPTSVIDYVVLPSWFKTLYSLPLWFFEEVLDVMSFDLDRLGGA